MNSFRKTDDLIDVVGVCAGDFVNGNILGPKR